MNSTLVIALLFSAVACQCVASEAVSARVDKLLALMGEDIAFRESARRTMASVVEEGKIPKAVAAEILKEINERDYLAQLGEVYISNLTEIEIDEAIAYLEVTANLTVFRGLIAAAAELDGIELATRRKTLATRHPAAWKATEMFSRSEAFRKISRIRDDSGPLKRKCSIEAFLSAQKSVRERLGIKNPTPN